VDTAQEGAERVFSPAEKDAAAASLPDHPEFGPVLMVLKGKKVMNIFGSLVIFGFIVLLLHSSVTGKLVTTTGEPSPINNPLILAAISIVLAAIGLYRFYNCTNRVLFYAGHMDTLSLFRAKSFAYKDITNIKFIENRRKTSLLNARLFSNRIVWAYQIFFASGEVLVLDSVKFGRLLDKMPRWTNNLNKPVPVQTAGQPQ
jgi:hypothetical protein